MSNDPALMDLATLLINGGVGIGLIKALYTFHNVAVKLEHRITVMETHLDWVKSVLGGRRKSDSGEGSNGHF
jgi:hypothetical protein